LLKTVQSIRSKKKKLPRAEFGQAGVFAIDDEANIYLRIPNSDAATTGDGNFDVELVQRWPMEQWKRVSRSLLKAGLEMLAYQHGKAFVMDERFDGVRRAVLDGRYTGWIAYTHENSELSTEVSLSFRCVDVHGISRLGLFVEAVIFGVRLCTAWPGFEPLLEQRGDADSFWLTELAREVPKDAIDELTLRVNVTFGSSEEIEVGDVHPGVAEIDRRFPPQ
jgi:hypothetical protein